MVTTRDIHDWLESLVHCKLNEDEGIMFGDPSRSIRGVSVCWMPSPTNIEIASAAGHDLLIHHEALLYPYPFTNRQPVNAMHWYPNVQRITALAESGMIATRLHGTLDELWIFEDFAEQLGLKRVAAKGKEYLHKVFEIEPVAYGDLIARIKDCAGLPNVRATSIKPNRTVRKVGLLWGGMGLFVNVSYQQQLLELARDIDVFIAGETDNYAFRFATELEIDVIETSHELSENRGLAKFSGALQQQFPQLEVKHINEKCVWEMR
jgi:putative NIF3 family GTP cyclohydrolase 1 type 2